MTKNGKWKEKARNDENGNGRMCQKLDNKLRGGGINNTRKCLLNEGGHLPPRGGVKMEGKGIEKRGETTGILQGEYWIEHLVGGMNTCSETLLNLPPGNIMVQLKEGMEVEIACIQGGQRGPILPMATFSPIPWQVCICWPILWNSCRRGNPKSLANFRRKIDPNCLGKNFLLFCSKIMGKFEWNENGKIKRINYIKNGISIHYKCFCFCQKIVTLQ